MFTFFGLDMIQPFLAAKINALYIEGWVDFCNFTNPCADLALLMLKSHGKVFVVQICPLFRSTLVFCNKTDVHNVMLQHSLDGGAIFLSLQNLFATTFDQMPFKQDLGNKRKFILRFSKMNKWWFESRLGLTNRTRAWPITKVNSLSLEILHCDWLGKLPYFVKPYRTQYLTPVL